MFGKNNKAGTKSAIARLAVLECINMNVMIADAEYTLPT